MVLRLFRNRTVLPRIAKAVHDLPLFAGLDAEQIHRLAGVCLATFEPGEIVFRAEDRAGRCTSCSGERWRSPARGAPLPVGVVRTGECLGEMSLLTAAAHSATATALTRVETAVLGHQDLAELIRLRPDIGLHIYRNLAVGLGEKLKRSGISPTSQCESSAPDPA